MLFRYLIFGLLIVTTHLSSQTVDISGTVTDTSGIIPLEGVIVNLDSLGLVDTTDSNGNFKLSDPVSIQQSIFNSNSFTIKLKNNNLSIRLLKHTTVSIATFNVLGKELNRIKGTYNIGSHTIKLPQLANGVFIHRIKIDNEVIMSKYSKFGNKVINSSFKNVNTNKRLRGMVQEVLDDVIVATKEGYINNNFKIFNTDTSGVLIKMHLNAGDLIDIDGNVYQTIKIGNQTWTVDNLKTSKYNDGSIIPIITDNSEWINDTLGAYCYYHNDSLKTKEYGYLYNWFTINTNKLAPEGWHIPTAAEWDTLQNYLISNGSNWDNSTSENKIAKSLASNINWHMSTNTGAVGNSLYENNSTGFSARPGGTRAEGNYRLMEYYGYWWSSTKRESSMFGASASARKLCYLNDFLDESYLYLDHGHSIRLIKDSD